MTENILVTGGAGYIGSHVCKALHQHGYTPVVFDNLCSGNKEAVKWGPFIHGDIRDREALSKVIQDYKPKAIMHFAALIQVGESVSNPSIYYHNNVYGSFCLLEEARQHGIKHMVFSSTAAVYGLPDVSPIAEGTPKDPINPYGRTKLMMEDMIRDYSQAYGLGFAILRYFNAAGADPEGETGTAYKVDSHIIPLLMRVASNLMDQIKIFGTDYATPDGTAIRDYIHVTDLAEAHILALEHILAGKENVTLNIGTNSGKSVLDVVNIARSVTGHDIPALITDRREGDPPILVADARDAGRILNWVPCYSDLETIIKTAWLWRQKQNHKM
ncbi:MAG TPA: UDP-glucose 4-epimerase GalE [Rhodospirillaceae bacterium]|nr:UDP-glucose 4-epimerase GalE [Rhodospirillaceae bacterium]